MVPRETLSVVERPVNTSWPTVIESLQVILKYPSAFASGRSKSLKSGGSVQGCVRHVEAGFEPATFRGFYHGCSTAELPTRIVGEGAVHFASATTLRCLNLPEFSVVFGVFSALPIKLPPH